MRPGPALLVDIGSTVVKICTRAPDGHLSGVEQVRRQPDVAPGDQARALIEARRRSTGISAVRICSSANGGLKTGILGLSRRHSIAAAARAVSAAGGNVVYSGRLSDELTRPAPPVDVLVLVGGVDGADLAPLRKALESVRLASYPRQILVWAGADAPGLTAGLPVDYQAANVLDAQLRPRPQGLKETIRSLYIADLIDHKGLGALADVTEAEIWPTPVVVGLAAQAMTTRRIPPEPATPFVLADVGGSTTDIFLCAELRAEHAGRSAPGESVVRHVFTDLGVAASRPGLIGQLVREPSLFELASAVDPARPRALHAALGEGAADALAPPVGFLACLFLALKRLTSPGVDQLNLVKAASFVITGGAWTPTMSSSVRRVINAACGSPGFSGSLLIDRRYQVWAHGIVEVPLKTD